MDASIIKFDYNGNQIPFSKGNDVMVNLTAMAKAYPEKNLSTIVNSQEISDYCASLSKLKNFSLADLLIVRRGGDNPGTWANRLVAIRVAQKLNSDLAVWVDMRVDELLKYGMTATQPTLEQMIDNPDLVISLATQLKKEREDKKRLEIENKNKQFLLEQKTEQLDESKEWYSIKRWAKEHGKNWRTFSWRKLKALSYELGYETKKIFDANYGQVNIYNVRVFEAYSLLSIHILSSSVVFFNITLFLFCIYILPYLYGV